MSQTLPDRIRLRLKQMNKSASAASLEAGLGRSAVQDILSGASGNPRIETLTKLAATLDTSLNYLVDGTDAPEATNIAVLPNNVELTITSMADRLEAGVYRDIKMSTSIEIDAEEGLMWRNIYSPGGLRLYYMADKSMTGLSICLGDFVTAARCDTVEEIPLIHGKLVVCARFIGQGIVETSLRLVQLLGESLSLECRSTEADIPSIIIETAEGKDSTFGDDPNGYMTANRELVMILGEATRIVRSLPTKPSS